jgi:hypothetical protein
MKQEITIRNTRELELKKSMLNFKFFSLMKKQLFSLVMLLALTVIAGTSAWAQDGLAPGSAVWHLANSTEVVTVTNHADFTYSWAITGSDCLGAPTALVGASIAGATNSATITYLATATGMYRITCTEIDPEGCSTTREFFTAIMTIDVAVIASDNLGAAVADLTTCNDWTATYGSALTPTTLVPNPINTGVLAGYRDDAYFNTRYVNVSFSTSNATGCVVAGMPAANTLDWEFDYDFTQTNYASANNFIDMSTGAAGVAFTAPTSDDSHITVTAPTTAFTIALRSNIQWGTTDTDANETFSFNATAVVVEGNGGEATPQQANNSSAAQTIFASPATSVITN